MNALIVGLGNPGLQYATTRHNIGFLATDALLDAMQQVSSQSGSKFACELHKGIIPLSSSGPSGSKSAVEPCFVAKPQTFMNLSGACVQPLSAWYRIPPERILVVHDDLDIVPGYMRYKCGGGDAGHKGLKSITERLGTPNYYRLRLGIGRPPHGGAVHPWVLGGLSQGDCDQLFALMPQIIDCIRAFVQGDLTLAARLGTLNPPKPPKVPKSERPLVPEESDAALQKPVHGDKNCDLTSCEAKQP